MNKNNLIDEASILNVAAYVCWALSHRLNNSVVGYVALAMISVAFLMTLASAYKLGAAGNDLEMRRKNVLQVVSAIVFQVVFVICFFLFR